VKPKIEAAGGCQTLVTSLDATAAPAAPTPAATATAGVIFIASHNDKSPLACAASSRRERSPQHLDALSDVLAEPSIPSHLQGPEPAEGAPPGRLEFRCALFAKRGA
jgi:hypothetical protein